MKKTPQIIFKQGHVASNLTKFSWIKQVATSVWLWSGLFLTYDPTVLALECGAGACDGSTGAGVAERGATGRAVERGAWAVSAGRCRAAGECRAGTDTLASHRALRRGGTEKRVKVHQECALLIKPVNEVWNQLNGWQLFHIFSAWPAKKHNKK